MIHADLDKILPEPDALEQITQIFHEVENYKELYVITKGGRPALAVINVDYLEELTGKPVAKDIPEEDFAQKKTEQPIEAKEIVDEETPLIEEEEESAPPSVPPAPLNVPPLKPEPETAPNQEIKPELMVDLSPNPVTPPLQPVPSGSLSDAPKEEPPTTTLPAAPTSAPTAATTLNSPTPPTPLITPDDTNTGNDDLANSSPLL